MLRKQIIKASPASPVSDGGQIDIAAVAIVHVTSESPGHPMDHAFDEHRGPGEAGGWPGSPVSRR